MEKSIEVLSQLASALGQRDEAPNIALAKQIAESADHEAVEVLVTHMTRRPTAQQNDCIKVLYEVGDLSPALIQGHLPAFLGLLTHKSNRLQWGGMTALACIARVNPQGIYDHLPAIIDAADKGSVITRDKAVDILIHLAGLPDFASDAFPLLFDQLRNSPENQFPMYAERALPVIAPAHKAEFVAILTERLGDMEKESKRKRVEKVLRRV